MTLWTPHQALMTVSKRQHLYLKCKQKHFVSGTSTKCKIGATILFRALSFRGFQEISWMKDSLLLTFTGSMTLMSTVWLNNILCCWLPHHYTFVVKCSAVCIASDLEDSTSVTMWHEEVFADWWGVLNSRHQCKEAAVWLEPYQLAFPFQRKKGGIVGEAKVFTFQPCGLLFWNIETGVASNPFPVYRAEWTCGS